MARQLDCDGLPEGYGHDRSTAETQTSNARARELLPWRCNRGDAICTRAARAAWTSVRARGSVRWRAMGAAMPAGAMAITHLRCKTFAAHSGTRISCPAGTSCSPHSARSGCNQFWPRNRVRNVACVVCVCAGGWSVSRSELCARRRFFVYSWVSIRGYVRCLGGHPPASLPGYSRRSNSRPAYLPTPVLPAAQTVAALLPPGRWPPELHSARGHHLGGRLRAPINRRRRVLSRALHAHPRRPGLLPRLPHALPPPAPPVHRRARSFTTPACISRSDSKFRTVGFLFNDRVFFGPSVAVF